MAVLSRSRAGQAPRQNARQAPARLSRLTSAVLASWMALAPAPVILILPATPALAVEPSEQLADPALEARARALSARLRCPVCQSENIDASNAQVAHDLRVLVRERLKAGDTDQQVLDYIVARYGEYVLFDPPKTGANLVLWLAGPALLILGGAIGYGFLRNRRREGEAPVTALDAEEEARIRALMED